MSVNIAPVTTKSDLEDVAELFKAYVQWLNLDLSFQAFNSELDGLPGDYAPPNGALYLAKSSDGKSIGCVALRSQLGKQICEMKRLYVVPEARGSGAGRLLAETVIDTAITKGYEKIRLDTLPRMSSAVSMYRSLGFRAIEAYYSTPLPDTIFFEKDLVQDSIR